MAARAAAAHSPPHKQVPPPATEQQVRADRVTTTRGPSSIRLSESLHLPLPRLASTRSSSLSAWLLFHCSLLAGPSPPIPPAAQLPPPTPPHLAAGSTTIYSSHRCYWPHRRRHRVPSEKAGTRGSFFADRRYPWPVRRQFGQGSHSPLAAQSALATRARESSQLLQACAPSMGPARHSSHQPRSLLPSSACAPTGPTRRRSREVCTRRSRRSAPLATHAREGRSWTGGGRGGAVGLSVRWLAGWMLGWLGVESHSTPKV